MPKVPATLFDPSKTFDDNFDNGPFPSAGAYKNPGEPGYDFLGHKLYSPFGIAAGSLPTSKHVAAAFKKGFDVVCYKTQRSVPFKVNDFPNVVYLGVEGDLTLQKMAQPIIGHLDIDKPIEELTITNSFGNPSRGPDFWVEDMKKAVAAQGPGQLLIASVVGTIQDGFGPDEYYDDFARAAGLAAKAGAPVIEINLSCPNVANEGILCYNPDTVVDICGRVKAKIGELPLVIKVGYFTSQQQPLLEEIITRVQPYVAAVSAINTLVVTIVDENGQQMLPGPGRLKGGACGRGIRWAGLDMVKRLNELRQKHKLNFAIIGVGGVATPDDFRHYREAGADVVQSVTAAMWNDRLAEQVKAGL